MQKKRAKAPTAKQKVSCIFKPDFRLAIFAALLGVALYINTLPNEFILDDGAVTVSNPHVMQGISGIPEILQTEMWHFQGINLGYYRPLSMITFAIETEFFGSSPAVYHAGNILLYGLTGFVLCVFLMNLFRNFHPVLSFIITVLFIAHPLHTEVTANIKSRDEMLSFLNMVLSFHFILKYYSSPGKKRMHLVLSCMFFYLALLSKETAMVGIFLIPLLFFFLRSSVKEVIVRSLPFVIILILFLWQKHLVVGTLSPEIPKDIVNYPYAEANSGLPNALLIFMKSIFLTVMPHPLSYDYSYNEIPAAAFSSPMVIAGLIALLGLAVFGLYRINKKDPIAFGILFFLASLVPALGFVILRGGIFAERFIYSSVLGFAVVLVFVLAKAAKMNFGETNFSWKHLLKYPLFTMPVIAITILYSFKTVGRNVHWKNNLTLASEDVKTSPNSCQVRKHLGNELINRGMEEKDSLKRREWFDKGIAQLREAVRINARHGEALFKMGVAWQTVNVNLDSAIHYYNLALRENPQLAIAYCNLGLAYEAMNKQKLASYFYNKALEADPNLPEAKQYGSDHKQKTGLDVKQFPSEFSLEELERTTEKKDAWFYYTTGNRLASQGDYEGGIKCFQKALELDPKQEAVYINLSNCYGLLGKYAENLEVLNRLLAINPNNPDGLKNIAVTHELMGNKDKAKEYRDKAAKFGSK